MSDAEDKSGEDRKGKRGQEMATAKASMGEAKANLGQGQLDLQEATLIAAANGTLLTRAVEPGSLLNAGSQVLSLSLTTPARVPP